MVSLVTDASFKAKFSSEIKLRFWSDSINLRKNKAVDFFSLDICSSSSHNNPHVLIWLFLSCAFVCIVLTVRLRIAGAAG
jgi:hypothetical protein